MAPLDETVRRVRRLESRVCLAKGCKTRLIREAGTSDLRDSVLLLGKTLDHYYSCLLSSNMSEENCRVRPVVSNSNFRYTQSTMSIRKVASAMHIMHA